MTMILDALGPAWLSVAVHLWQTTLVLIPIFLLGRALRQAPPAFLHGLWSLGLLKLLIPMSFFGGLMGSAISRVPVLETVPVGAGAWDRIGVILDPTRAWHTGESVVVLPIAVGLALLTVGWLVGVGWSLTRLVRDATAARRAWPHDFTVPDAGQEEKLTAALEHTDIPRSVVILTPSSTMPCVMGFIRPRIVLPVATLDGLPTLELRAILLHEELHRRRRDPLRSLGQRLVSAVFFYYPLLTPLLRRLNRTSELMCDERVVRSGVAPSVLARALARTIRMRLEAVPVSVVGDGCPSLLRQRFERLTRPGSYRATLRHRMAIGVAALLVLVGSLMPLPAGSVLESEAALDFDTTPRVIESVAPTYPDGAREDQVQGRVLLQVRISEQGEVTAVEVESAEAPTSLVDAATEALWKWRFEPALKEGRPVKSAILVPFSFALK